ncbi:MULTISPECIES: hypothetical protein [Clostridium]|uniref:Uncharacterized protein n=5 Tax=Clostridium TaxID=1485 RepID=A0A162LCK6_9CLOT|nr:MULTISPECIES: hypothetical protein [Clostridium]ADK16332.1 hypothetical protein CLJU_c32860 [Clostridium ljungdahlii DSM 13528]AGY75409.1 hypothetical protein CAETHG_1184 [Clostridium autoethanogenum DSM 10061]ALU35575.1 Hypothetical protein CLAU_1146 [Clostridium autoethanogenum DSM 10061]OAA89794.1 hypothetical protein WX45_01631 [Clostridium ljungdahlii DSM 13528]OAA91776.1 hypothetical protein WY13_00420 [Clostridium ljungdahlii]
MSKKNDKLEISWFGIDGFLVLLYFIVVGVIYYAISAHNDFIVGRLIPYGIMIAVTLIFINYLGIIFKFSRKSKGNKEK